MTEIGQFLNDNIWLSALLTFVGACVGSVLFATACKLFYRLFKWTRGGLGFMQNEEDAGVDPVWHVHAQTLTRYMNTPRGVIIETYSHGQTNSSHVLNKVWWHPVTNRFVTWFPSPREVKRLEKFAADRKAMHDKLLNEFKQKSGMA